MGIKYNAVTGKWEQTQGSTPTAPTAPTAGRPAAGPATVKQTPVNISGAKQSNVNLQKVRSVPGSKITPTQAPAQKTAPVSTELPANSTTNFVGPMPPSAPMSPQDAINAMTQAVIDEAANYRITYGEEPPASWWDTRMYPVKQAQSQLDDALKAQSKSSASAAAAAAKAKADAEERKRKIAGSKAGEAFLRTSAEDRKTQALKRVADLYDPLKTKSEEEMAVVLQNASDAFDLAEKQVEEAGQFYQGTFQPSMAYGEVPISTYTTGANPLLAALQQQGASTADVEKATAEANQYAQSVSDLSRWAANQLNVGQQNYDLASQQAAAGALTSALQGLGQRRAEVKTGIEKQFADILSEIAQKKTGAESDADTAYQDLIDKANEMVADRLSEYGVDKPKEQTPLVGTKVKKKVTPKVTPTPVAKTTPNLSGTIRRS